LVVIKLSFDLTCSIGIGIEEFDCLKTTSRCFVKALNEWESLNNIDKFAANFGIPIPLVELKKDLF